MITKQESVEQALNLVDIACSYVTIQLTTRKKMAQLTYPYGVFVSNDEIYISTLFSDGFIIESSLHFGSDWTLYSELEKLIRRESFQPLQELD